MAEEWKRLVLQNGKWVATFTAIGIAAGALMWYQREAPRYPSTIDEAEVRFALLERQAAIFGSGANASNAVGFYPSRRFWTSTEYGAQSVQEMTRKLSGEFINLWKLGWGASSLQRPIGDYPNIIDDSEKMGLAYWQEEHNEDAAFFGDYPYLQANRLYMATNMLFETGRALSDMRWTLQSANDYIYMPESLATNAMVTWQSTNCYDKSLPAAYSMALSSLRDAVPEGGALSGLEGFSVVKHYVNVYWVSVWGPPYDQWRVSATEHVQFRARRVWRPMATNCVATQVGCFDKIGDEFWHPYGWTSHWETAQAPRRHDDDGIYFDELLYDWHGRIPEGDIRATIGTLEDTVWIGSRTMGWQPKPTFNRFVVDWKFQSLTDRDEYWK